MSEMLIIHPGEILREEFLAPYKLSAYKLAKIIGVPRTRIERIVREERPITIDTAWRLAKAFSTTPQFWINLQTNYDLANSPPIEGYENIQPVAGLAA